MADMNQPIKNTAFTLSFSLYRSDGTIILNPGTYTKKVSVDGGAMADIAAAVTEEDTTYGQLSLVLATGEMNGDFIWVMVKDDTAGCVPFTCSIYPSAGSAYAEAALIHAHAGTIEADVAAIHTHVQALLDDLAAVHTHVNDLHDTDLPAVKAETALIKADTTDLLATPPAQFIIKT